MNFIIEIHDLKYLRFDLNLNVKSAFIQILTKVAIAAQSLQSFNESFEPVRWFSADFIESGR